MQYVPPRAGSAVFRGAGHLPAGGRRPPRASAGGRPRRDAAAGSPRGPWVRWAVSRTTEEPTIDKPTIAGRIREFLETEFAGQGSELTDTTNLLEDFFVDSFGIIDTVMFLENTFGVQISRADINGENFRDVASLTEFVHARLSR